MPETRRIEKSPGPIDASVRPPGSKSLTIRALAVAALAQGRSHLYGALVADDTSAMTGAIRSLGVGLDVTTEPWAIDGEGGHLFSGGGAIDAHESGLTARIALAMAAFSESSTTITGRGRLLERPIDSLVDVLGRQGVSVQTTGGFLPATVNGQGGLWGGDIVVDCSKSSQFATAVLLVSPLMTEPARVRLTGLAGSSGYLDSTVEVMEAFGASIARTITGFETQPTGYTAADYLIEPDASAAVYPMVAAAITGGRVLIAGLRLTSSQPDMGIARHLESMGCRVTDNEDGVVVDGPDRLSNIDADLSTAPDGALGLAIACAFADGPSRLSGLHSLRYKESDRLEALTSELSKVGVVGRVEDDTLTISPPVRHGGLIDSHGDHRVAMSMALVGLAVDGVEVADPGVVAKTWPGFWEMLAGLTKNT